MPLIRIQAKIQLPDKGDKRTRLVYTLRDFARDFEDEFEVDAALFSSVVKSFFQILYRTIVGKKFSYEIPGKFGHIYISSHVRELTKSPINWRLTAKYKKVIRCNNMVTERRIFTWTWEKPTHQHWFYELGVYRFKPCRFIQEHLSMSIKDSIKNPLEKNYTSVYEAEPNFTEEILR